MRITVSNASKWFGSVMALDGVSLDIASGELVALLGPSGSGKTSLLRIIAGLDWPDRGEVRFDGQNALGLTVGQRNVGFVFQNYALFRHMTVFENIAFGLRSRPRRNRPGAPAIRARVEHLLGLVQLDALAGRYPHQLSGGQRQRVALARALANAPGILLLDEPFGALDARVRMELRRWLRRLHNEIHVTSVFVTHDQEEALEISDRIVVMERGKIIQVGTPREVYEEPATPFVHEFIGESIALPVEISQSTVHYRGTSLGLDVRGLAQGRAQLYVRPHEMAIVPTEASILHGKVKSFIGIGPLQRLAIDLGGETEGENVEIEVAAQNAGLSLNEVVGLWPNRYKLYPAA